MNDVLKFTEGIQKKLTSNSRLAAISVLSSGIVVVISLFVATSIIRNNNKVIYVLDDNGAIETARRQDRASVIDSEVKNQVQLFHELMFNLSPDRELINAHRDAAMELCDVTGFDYWNSREEEHFYSRLIDRNVVEEIKTDSVVINTSTYPYRAAYFGKLFILRDNSTSKFDFVSTCQLVSTRRTDKNRHGLTIEAFREVKKELIETRKRQK